MRVINMEINLAYIVNTALGTVPLAAFIIGWIIKVERRLTRIETTLEIAHEDNS